MWKYVFPDDIAVRVWREERERPPEYASFYKGIVEVMIIEKVDATFIPTLPRTPDKWPPVLPPNVNVDVVESEEQARLFTTFFSEYIVTPNAQLAGQKEFVPQFVPANKYYSGCDFPFGVVFYVTPEQFALFSSELLDIELNYQTSGSRCARLSEIKRFECIKFILNQIRPLRKELYMNGYTVPTNGYLFHDNSEIIAGKNGTQREHELNGSHHQSSQVEAPIAA